MIHFDLRCPQGHGFDGWFRSGEEFERQRERSLVSCPTCGATEISKALMAPALAGIAKDDPAPSRPVVAGLPAAKAAEVSAQLQALARELRSNSNYVGKDFAEEARRIHFGESEERRIHGEASGADIRALAEDGIAAFPLPPLPEDQH